MYGRTSLSFHLHSLFHLLKASGLSEEVRCARCLHLLTAVYSCHVTGARAVSVCDAACSHWLSFLFDCLERADWLNDLLGGWWDRAV